MPPCRNCRHAASLHNWKQPRIRGHCQHYDGKRGCFCKKYIPKTDEPRPMNFRIARAALKKRKKT